eukprot:420623_1
MINVFHDIDNCVVAQSLRSNYKYQLCEWEKKQKLKQEQLKLQKQKQEKEGESDEFEDDNMNGNDNNNNNMSIFPSIPQLKNRQKQKLKLPTESSWAHHHLNPRIHHVHHLVLHQ